MSSGKPTRTTCLTSGGSGNEIATGGVVTGVSRSQRDIGHGHRHVGEKDTGNVGHRHLRKVHQGDVGLHDRDHGQKVKVPEMKILQ